MKIQLAHIYRGERFIHYGLAVNGQLIDGQMSCDISAGIRQLPKITSVISLDSEIIENPVKIDIEATR